LLLAPVGTTLVGAFPLNTSLWSLNVEMVVNVAYALFNRLLTTRVLLAIAAVSFVALAVIAYGLGAVSYGTSNLDLLAGYLRALISFPVGVVLWRLRARLPKLKLGVLTLFLVAGLMMTGIGINARNAWGVTYDLAFIALAVPMLVIVAINNEPSPRFRLLFARMGSGSYALYALHQPIIHAARRLAADHGGVPTYLTIGAGLIPALVLLAWLVDRLFDTPIRRWLKPSTARPVAVSPIEAEAA
jgi:peptidoglycan/LPS O-acetylase OafA/YrhL